MGFNSGFKGLIKEKQKFCHRYLTKRSVTSARFQASALV